MKTLSIVKITFALSIISYSISICAMGLDQTSFKQPGGNLFFFENGLPIGITGKGDIKISNKHKKDGKNSLKWKFIAGDELIINHTIGYKDYVNNELDQSRSTFSMWVYNSDEQNQKAKVIFSENNNEKVFFEFNLNFKGWRQLLVPFSDMNGNPTEIMDKMTIRIPKTASPGLLFIDQLMLSIPVDPRWPTRDAIVPFVNLATDNAPNQHWLSLYRYQGFLESADLKNILWDEKDTKITYQRLDDFILNNKPKYHLEEIVPLIKSYNLIEIDGVVSGEPLDNGNRLKNFLDKGVNKGLLNDEGFKTVFNVKKLRDYSDLMLSIALHYQQTTDEKTRNELSSLYVKMTRYALNQGYDNGSGLGTAHHMGYTLRSLFDAHFISRDILKDNKLLAQVADMMAWYSLTGRIYRPVEEMKNFNVDIMNTQLRGMLYSILMQQRDDIKMSWLKQFQFWLSYSIKHSQGLGGGFKYDGSIFHHAQHYPAYANGALKGITPVVYALSGTPFSIDKEAHTVLRNAVLMTDISSYGGKIISSVSGRHPDGKQTISVSPFRYMALAGTPDKSSSIDIEMAQTYLRLNSKNDHFSNFLLDKKITPNHFYQGSWAMNFANLAIQRRDSWMASMRGFSRYLVSHETYANANRYGRYINYGQLEIINQHGRGFSHDGWDWNRWPGTTAPKVELKELEAKLRNVDTFSGLEEMLLSEQTYSGALKHQNNVLFAMKLQGHPKYNASFSANKSAFFFNNRIVALGSNINSIDNNLVQTTLFQHTLPNKSNTKKAKDILIPTPKYLMDPANNAYILNSGQNILLSSGVQNSLSQKDSSVTAGNFKTAVIDHGINPKNAQYQYMILVDTDVHKTENFVSSLSSKQPDIRVLKHDSFAHIVWDRDSNTTGYVFFDQNNSLSDPLIVSNEYPSMVMATMNNEILSLSLLNPDLNLYQGKDLSQYDSEGILKEVSIYSRKWKDNISKSSPVSLVLNGIWKLSDKTQNNVDIVNNNDGTTTLITNTKNAKSITVSLYKK
ncbi:TPA: chondroitinase family polysaccharide lyase [Photobacterium damselae]